MLKLYALLSLKYIRNNKLRSFLSLSSIVFGIALVLATTVMNKSIVESYKNMINKMAGKSQIVVRSSAGVFNTDYLEKVQKVEGVKDAVPSFQSFARLVKGDNNSSLYLLGIDNEKDKKVRDYELERGLMPDDKNAIIISQKLADRFGYKISDEVQVLTAQGLVNFQISGILANKGISMANGGNFGAISIKDAQELYGQQGKYNFIDITLKDNINTEDTITKIKKATGGNLLVERPTTRGQEVEDMLSTIKFLINFLSASALFVSLFLIFNTIMVAINERRKEIGTLRALGLMRRQITQLFLIEAGLIGLTGSILGVGLGGLTLGYMEKPAMDMFKYFVRLDNINFQLRLEDILLSLVMGTAVAVLAAIFPAREGGRTSPVEAMKGRTPLSGNKYYWSRFILGLALFTIAIVAMLLPIPNKIKINFTLALLIGPTLMIPTLIKFGARPVSWLLTKFFGTVGRLASDSLVKSTNRTAVTVASLMIGITIVTGMGGNLASQRKTFQNYISQGLFGDVMVRSATSNISTKGDVNLKNAMKKDILGVKGVNKVETYRATDYTYNGKPITIMAEEGQLDRRVLTKGKLENIKKRFARGDGIMISEIFEEKQGIHYGDKITLNTPTGVKTFEVVGIYNELSSMNGALEMSYGQFNKYWADDNANSFNILVEKGFDANKVKDEIANKLGSKHQLIVQTNDEYIKEVFKAIDDTQGMFRILEMMTVVVAFMGVINTLMISVLERTKEIGILRAIGSLRSDIRKMILVEAGLIGIFGAILGVLVGSIYSYFAVMANRQNGFSYQYAHPWSLIWNLILASVFIALIAGLYPANRAARMDIVSAIEYE